MNLIFSVYSCIHIGFYAAAVHKCHPVFSVYEFLVHLVVLVYHLISWCIPFIDTFPKKPDRLPGFFILPVIIISSEKINKFPQLIVHIGFFPGASIGVASLSPVVGNKPVKIFPRFYSGKPGLL